MESHHGPYLGYFLAGTIFLIVALFHHRMSHRFAYVDSVFFIIETILSFIIAFEYFDAGKKGLPWMYIIAGLMQLSGMLLFIKKRKKVMLEQP